MLFTKTNTMVSSRLLIHATSTWYMVKSQRLKYSLSTVLSYWRQMVLHAPLLLRKERSLGQSKAVLHKIALAMTIVCVFCLRSCFTTVVPFIMVLCLQNFPNGGLHTSHLVVYLSNSTHISIQKKKKTDIT